MFSILEAAKAAAPATPAAAGGDGAMGGMGSMLGGAAKGGFTGGTEKDKQMNSLMMFFTNSMNEMFGSMAPKPAATQQAAQKK